MSVSKTLRRVDARDVASAWVATSNAMMLVDSGFSGDFDDVDDADMGDHIAANNVQWELDTPTSARVNFERDGQRVDGTALFVKHGKGTMCRVSVTETVPSLDDEPAAEQREMRDEMIREAKSQMAEQYERILDIIGDELRAPQQQFAMSATTDKTVAELADEAAHSDPGRSHGGHVTPLADGYSVEMLMPPLARRAVQWSETPDGRTALTIELTFHASEGSDVDETIAELTASSEVLIARLGGGGRALPGDQREALLWGSWRPVVVTDDSQADWRERTVGVVGPRPAGADRRRGSAPLMQFHVAPDELREVGDLAVVGAAIADVGLNATDDDTAPVHSAALDAWSALFDEGVADPNGAFGSTSGRDYPYPLPFGRRNGAPQPGDLIVVDGQSRQPFPGAEWMRANPTAAADVPGLLAIEFDDPTSQRSVAFVTRLLEDTDWLVVGHVDGAGIAVASSEPTYGAVVFMEPFDDSSSMTWAEWRAQHDAWTQEQVVEVAQAMLADVAAATGHAFGPADVVVNLYKRTWPGVELTAPIAVLDAIARHADVKALTLGSRAAARDRAETSEGIRDGALVPVVPVPRSVDRGLD